MSENPSSWNDDVKAIFEASKRDEGDNVCGLSPYAKIERRVVAPLRDKLDFILKVLNLTDEHDCQRSLMWRVDNGEVTFAIDCSDVFAWGCTDAEEITLDSLSILEQALKDDEDEGPALYCARVRKMRPQGAMYKYIKEENQHWFDECGPLRKVGVGNPHKHPSESQQANH